MTLITKQEIEELHAHTHDICVSIFIPTHRGGKKVINEVDQIMLKNELKDVRKKLEGKNLQQDEIKKMLAPAQTLLDDPSFWREQSDGLALFISEDFYKMYTLPVYFQEFNYVSDGFYLKPLLPMFNGNGTFYLMRLELGNVKLFEATRYSYTELDVADMIPDQKEDRVGYDFEQKSLQSHSGGAAGAMYHGQEAATGKRKTEIKQYFRAINDGLHPLLNNQTIPLIIVGQEYLFDIYKEVNTYAPLVQHPVKADLSSAEMGEIHQLAWEHMEPVFNQKRDNAVTSFKEGEGTGKTANGIEQVLSNAIHGKVQALFCENNADLMGTYENVNGQVTVKIDENDSGNSISLINEAAIKTFLQGGDVYLLEKEEMPNPNSRVNALYRY